MKAYTDIFDWAFWYIIYMIQSLTKHKYIMQYMYVLFFKPTRACEP